ncbi:MAG: peroxiredoxin [Armatimonadetes bacterium]|nr:peroxiredoxin [Armatimonadota bacterium]
MAAEVGKPAPDATVINADRQAVKLSSLRGKPAVLAFFPGAWTGVCDKEMCTFRDSMARFNAVNVQVVGISVDSPFALKMFAEQYSLNFPLMSDFNREAIRAYGVVLPEFVAGMKEVSQRAVFVLDKDGVVRWKWVADVPRNEPPYDDVEKAVKAAS